MCEAAGRAVGRPVRRSGGQAVRRSVVGISQIVVRARLLLRSTGSARLTVRSPDRLTIRPPDRLTARPPDRLTIRPPDRPTEPPIHQPLPPQRPPDRAGPDAEQPEALPAERGVVAVAALDRH